MTDHYEHIHWLLSQPGAFVPLRRTLRSRFAHWLVRRWG